MKRPGNQTTILKILLSAIFLGLFAHPSYGQKQLIDSSVYGKWPSLGSAGISNNGRYLFYFIDNQPIGKSTLIVSSADGQWKKYFVNATKPSFSDDNKTILFLNEGNLFLYTLGTNVKDSVRSVADYEKPDDVCRFIMLHLRNSNDLILKDIVNGKERKLQNVTNFVFDTPGNILLLQVKSGGSDGQNQKLQYIDLLSGKTTTIWSGLNAANYAFYLKSGQIAFLAESRKDTAKVYAIWYYKKGMDKAKLILRDLPHDLDSLFIANGPLSFSSNGTNIFFSAQVKAPIPKNHPDKINSLTIWNYKNKYLPSDKSSAFLSLSLTFGYRCSFNVRNKDVALIGGNGVVAYPGTTSNNFVLGEKDLMPTSFYATTARPSKVLISIKNGSRKYFTNNAFFSPFPFSPNEKFVIWFDLDSLSYFSYNVISGSTVNISKAIPQHLYDDRQLLENGKTRPFGIAGWLPDSQRILLYDAYDIWEVDPNGVKPPVNITNFYGRENWIALSIINFNSDDDTETISAKQTLWLAGYQTITKHSGFWKTSLDNSNSDPQLCSQGPYAYYVPRIGYGMVNPSVEYEGGFKPIKAKKSNYFLVQRQSAINARNIFITNDFKSFRQISDISPQKKYNWLTAEPIRWKAADGHELQGTIYKPENFDSTKKYPVIFHYYVRKSDAINTFLLPDYDVAVIDIPTYVSNGYVVCVTDIYYPFQHTGRGVINSVESAAKYIASFPWADSTKFGICGHSHGGWETNMLVTHSHLFAAASEAAGVSDQISSYGQLTGDGSSREAGYELGIQINGYGIGVTPWTNPQIYIENSPIFFVGQVSTPLLMMHNKEDGAVPYPQAIEFFQALKRAGKKVWLLEYDHEGHALYGNKEDAADYTIRTQQFFDHYLKGKPAPDWMTDDEP